MSTVAVHADVVRDGRETKVLIADVVPGDLVVLRAGDVVPGDCRVVWSNGLLVNESALTGENYPRRKTEGIAGTSDNPLARSNMVYLGTHVASGEGRAVVETTGVDTKFGKVTEHVSRQHLPTAFERGITRFGYLLMQWTGILVAGIFAFNLVVGRPTVESLLFSLSLTVGLTPQMLPAIVTLSLSRGTASMARRKVVVKRLDAIEDIGGMDILCTDKTGTITVGSVGLKDALATDGEHSDSVRRLAWLNAHLQRGFANPMDDAILSGPVPSSPDVTLLGEVPFDFMRKRVSVAVDDRGRRLLITKGALEPLLALCSKIRQSDDVVPFTDTLLSAMTIYRTLSADGLRVIGVATRDLHGHGDIGVHDEIDMVFEGFLTFDDPPKHGVREGIARLAELGVSVCVISGDNALASAHTARMVGIDPSRMVTGDRVSAVADSELPQLVEGVAVFAEVDPIQKERIVRAFSRGGHTVGFLGDGINDTPALHAADVGISVDNAVDVAKQTADLVLLEKDLSVVAAGIEEGRRVFANTLKYVNVTTSANFGNMLSFALATMFLPFLPLLPLQILLLNFLSDLPGMTIATDSVDPEQLQMPHRWDISAVRRFMIVFGVASTVFDLLAFALLRWVFADGALELRSGWFILSTFTELAAMLVLRTQRRFWRSAPSGQLFVSSVLVAIITFAIPYSPIATVFQVDGPPADVNICLVLLTVAYVTVNEILKSRIPIFHS